MSTFQTLLALVVLIYVLCVIVQAVQEAFKQIFSSKAKTMEKTITEFMGAHLTLNQVRGALQTRGLDITALEHFNKDDFRHLLDGIPGLERPLQGVIADAQATFEQNKNNIAAAYDAARAKFQASYTKHNKIWVLIFSAVVVLVLNANLIFLHREVAADQAMSRKIADTADKLVHSQGKEGSGGSGRTTTQNQDGTNAQPERKPPSTGSGATHPAQKNAPPRKAQPYDGLGQKQEGSQAGAPQPSQQSSDAAGSQQGNTNSKKKGSCSQPTSSTNPEQDYKHTRDCVKELVNQYPILVRWAQSDPKKKNSFSWFWPKLAEDWNGGSGWFDTTTGLVLMWLLVSLGAPFSNDVLKGMMGVNNALNTQAKKAS